MDLKLLSLLLLMYSVNLGVIITIVPLYSESLGADKMFVGLTVSAYAIAYTLSAPLWGKASDLLGRRLALSLGMLGYSISVFLFAFASDPGQILVIRLLSGFTDSSFWTVPAALIADMYIPQGRGAALGKIGTVQSAGLIIGPFLGGILLSGLNYSSVFYICSALIFSTAILVFFGIEEKSKVSSKEVESYPENWLKFKDIAKKSFAIVYVNVAFSAIAFGVVVSQLIVHASEMLGPGKEYLLGLPLTSYCIAQTFIQPPAGKLSDIIGRYRATLLAYIICALGFSILTFAQSLLLLLIAVVIAGLGVGALHVTLTASIMDMAPSPQRGLVSGFQNIAWGAGYFVGPMVGGIVAIYSVGAPYIFCAIAAVVGGVLTLYMKPYQQLALN